MAFFDLAGQTAIVTGGAQGIGEGIVHRLANAGAQVAVADKSFDGARAVAEQLQSKELKGFPIAVDVTDRTSVEAMVEEVLARSEKVDVLVNNAGIAGRAAPVWGATCRASVLAAGARWESSASGRMPNGRRVLRSRAAGRSLRARGLEAAAQFRELAKSPHGVVPSV